MMGSVYPDLKRYVLILAGLLIVALLTITPVAALEWTVQTVDSVGSVGEYTSLALDNKGYPHISYRDATKSDLKYAVWNGTAWTNQTIDSVGSVGEYTSLALNSSSYPSISYYDGTNTDLKYAAWSGTAWTLQTIDSTVNVVGTYTSLALDSKGNPRISYYDGTNTDLKYAAWSGTAWVTQTVDSTGDVGKYTSLTLDQNDNPCISFYDTTNTDLKYAAWNGAGWSTQTIDSTGSVGLYTSIALDSSGNPHISYYDTSNWNLKYAKGTTVNAGFTATPTSGATPLVVSFSDTSTGTPSAWTWYFGDGGVSTSQNPVHTYTTLGTYTVYMTNKDSFTSNTSVRIGYITVSAASGGSGSGSGSGSSGSSGSSGGGDSGGSSPSSGSGSIGTVNANVGGGSAVDTVTVTGTGVNGVIVTGRQQDSLQPGVPPIDPHIYQYIEITPARFGSITGATINFEVPVSWLEAQQLTTGDIAMNRYHEGVWTALPTTFLGVNNNVASYSAQSPGFSLFAITPKKNGAQPATASASCPVIQPVSCPVCPAPATGSLLVSSGGPTVCETVAPKVPAVPETGFPFITGAIIAFSCIGIGTGGFMLVRKWWIQRQNPALFRQYD
jgi:PGF-pre-PGF domain-containing protein